MIDINTIISNALIAAVQQAVAPLVERIAALEKNEEYLTNRIAALEAAAPQPAITIDEAKMVEALNSQEWFWEKMQRFAVGAAEEAMDDHLQTYDHDSYDAVVSDSDDYTKSDDIEDAVREAIGNLTFEVSVS